MPFGRGFYDGFVATSGDVAVEDGTPFTVVEATHPTAGAPPPLVRLRARRRARGRRRHQPRRRHPLRLSLGRVFDLGLAGTFGSAAAPTGAQSCGAPPSWARSASSGGPSSGSACASTAALGWQLLSGTVQLDGQQLTGTEPRGLRYEAAGGVNVQCRRQLRPLRPRRPRIDGVFPQGIAVVAAARRIPQSRPAVPTLIEILLTSR